MTDKQIIIDGVDIKDCKRRIGKDNYCRYYKRPCSENNYNCIWKKYLRKEQECKELKRQHQGDKSLITSTGKMNYQLLQEYDKLKNCLAEIKEIAETISQPMGTGKSCNRVILANQILQKISECGGVKF